MYEFMLNALYLLCGILALCVAGILLSATVVGAMQAIRKGRKHGGD